MNSEASSESWFSGSWPLRILLAAIAVMIGAWLLQELLREVPFMAARVKAPNPHEFVVWFYDQQQRCSTEEADEFSKAVGIIYTDVGARNPKILKVPGSGRADLCKELDGQIVADVIIRSYKLANEQLIRYIGRQQNDVIRIIDTMGVTELVKEKQRAVEEAQAQMTKNRERIAAILNLSK